MPLPARCPGGFSSLHAPPEQELLLPHILVYVSVVRGYLRSGCTDLDSLRRLVIERQCLVNQGSDLDTSTQTYMCGFPNLGLEF